MKKKYFPPNLFVGQKFPSKTDPFFVYNIIFYTLAFTIHFVSIMILNLLLTFKERMYVYRKHKIAWLYPSCASRIGYILILIKRKRLFFCVYKSSLYQFKKLKLGHKKGDK